jgi:hypothetical protein
MIRKRIFGTGLATASILTVALVLASAATSGALELSTGNCVTDRIRDRRAEGLVLTDGVRIDNGDGTFTGVFTCCPACSNSQPPCLAPCELAQATMDLKTGEVTCQ